MSHEKTPLSARIVILNYNGEDLLRECLPSIVLAAEKASYPTSVTVLDNLSKDRSEAYIKENYPQVSFVRAKENRVLCSYNNFLETMTEPIAILLNNDIRVAENFVDPLIEHFRKDPSTFMVAPRVMTFDGLHVEGAATKAGIRFGMFYASARYPGYEKDMNKPSRTFSSGFGAVSVSSFRRLGGYDDLYLPGIMEDCDLCLAAERAGMHSYYEPDSVVFHKGQTSFHRKYGKKGTSEIAYRNTFLFMWKNYATPSVMIPHILFLPPRFLLAILRGNFGMITGFFRALFHRRGS